MNIVDSSGWLEYFADGPNADFFAPAVQDTDQLVVPTISIYEVFKRVLQQRGEGEALQATAVVAQGQGRTGYYAGTQRGQVVRRPPAANGR
jgi:uncharacterized protein with PIN domain